MNRFHIVGPGALGLCFAKQLSAHCEVHLITKAHHPRAFFYQHGAGTVSNISANVLHTPTAPIDNLMLFTKAFDVSAALAQLKPYLSERANIIISHNGMQDLSALKETLSAHHALYFLLTQQAAFKPKADTVTHVSQGPSTLGAINPAATQGLAALHQLLAQNIAKLTTSADIHRARWQKLMINLAINPIATVHELKNGEVQSPRYCQQVMALLAEACLVAQAQGVALHLADALDSAYQVMAATADNYCSMLQDQQLGRANEIDAMCGYIVKQAQQFEIATPVNHAYWQMLKGDKPSHC